MWYRLNRAFFAIWFQLHFGFRVEGRVHEPAPPFIVIANHASAVDIPLVTAAIRTPLAFAAKTELMRLAPVRAWIRSVGGFFVRRGEADRAAVRMALGILRRGGALAIFAEGTRSPDGHLRPFEEGAAYWALRAGVPVLPLGIAGSQRTMPQGSKWPRRRSPVLVRIGPPIEVPKAEGRLTRQTIMEWTRRFERAVAALLPPDQQPLPDPLTAPAPAPPTPAGSP
ncbi:MAG: lysophospholipid acyltransferase family protein [bacterium]